MIDLPIIQLTATGLSMKGSRKATRKNLRARISALSSKRQAEGDRVLHEHGQHVEDHVAERVPEIGVVTRATEIVEAVEVRPSSELEVPVGEGDVEAEEGREDHHRDGEQERGQQEQRALAALAAHQHLADAERDAPTAR